MIRIGRIYWFSSAHFIPSHEGACRHPHGHNYKVEIVVEGEPCKLKELPNWGMIMDFKELDKIIDPIIKKFDHSMLNDFMENPTAENISKEIAHAIMMSFIKVKINITSLSKVRIWENHKSYAEWVKT